MSLIPKPTPALPDHVLKIKVAVVTGAAANIGLSIAEAFAEAGADVAMLYGGNMDAIKRAEELAAKNGVKVLAYQVDLRTHQNISQVVENVLKDFGKIDIWVANAGIAQDDTSVIDGPPEVFADIVAVNYTSAIFQAAIVGKVFRAQGSGNLIVTASGAATSTIRPTNQSVYNSSKAAIRMLARSLAQEFKDFARVNSVSPGYMGDAQGAPESEIANALSRQVLNRTGDYRELKGAYLYLASDASTFTTGSDIVCDGGYTL
ncbi:putative L-xylulose reductase [Meredithblackwellia eburnea MCA 4105]